MIINIPYHKSFCIFLLTDKKYLSYTNHCINIIESFKYYEDFKKTFDIYIYCNDKESYNYFSSIKSYYLFYRKEIKNLKNYHTHKDVPSSIVYYKYLAFTELFNNYDYVIYLDSDILIINPYTTFKDLLRLCDENNGFFIVKNNFHSKEVRIINNIKKAKPILSNLKIKFNNTTDMINAGVIVISKKYRSSYYYQSLIEITNELGDTLEYADQSAISLWCKKHNIKPSEEYKYNFQMPLYTKFFLPRYKKIPFYFLYDPHIVEKLDLRIIHYSGKYKPDDPNFLKWNLMGKFAKLFQNLYNSNILFYQNFRCLFKQFRPLDTSIIFR